MSAQMDEVTAWHWLIKQEDIMDANSLITMLVLVLVALAALLFLGGIVSAGYWSLKSQPDNMPAFLAQATTVIGGTLSTNLGAVLGLAVAQSARGMVSLPSVPALARPLQIGAAWVYVGGLLLALAFWAWNKFSTEPDKVVSTLPDLTKTLLGVVVGVLAIALGVSR
jgi:hypothetical protein